MCASWVKWGRVSLEPCFLQHLLVLTSHLHLLVPAIQTRGQLVEGYSWLPVRERWLPVEKGDSWQVKTLRDAPGHSLFWIDSNLCKTSDHPCISVSSVQVFQCAPLGIATADVASAQCNASEGRFCFLRSSAVCGLLSRAAGVAGVTANAHNK